MSAYGDRTTHRRITYGSKWDYTGRCPECDGIDILTREKVIEHGEGLPRRPWEKKSADVELFSTPEVLIERGCLRPECDAIWVELWGTGVSALGYAAPNYTRLLAQGRNKARA
jgi:hypothetical protein